MDPSTGAEYHSRHSAEYHSRHSAECHGRNGVEYDGRHGAGHLAAPGWHGRSRFAPTRSRSPAG
ncbi:MULTISPECIES: hypothetical protein [unclassified Streptomyces]|uniref:hypothetical protein n=1 Tax=unclassified Streptomyces TaxID=2593676 RepID=UPI00087E3D72|nr:MULTISPECIES: hypothetical protein [unclassified Streptomyces]PBC80437.1 hypothetical protein BX261_0261 [Streptomyces sp. 2321.6]SDR58624.1 hypothetical protein SAMN05216511_6960 [Streptomyces sp. KS_16]SEB74608.1 hypothetical protein SAMN05428940_0262 [Streptomyces sp. 2133.1]SNC60424.1 hypothetical protein SAMN06272741_0263 [Streptomyces sp. 2114.4]